MDGRTDKLTNDKSLGKNYNWAKDFLKSHLIHVAILLYIFNRLRKEIRIYIARVFVNVRILNATIQKF